MGPALIVVTISAFLVWRATSTGSGAQVVDVTGAPRGYKTIELEGVRVDIPAEWERSDRRHCESTFERWARPDEVGCGTTGDGVSFYASATFDSRYGPGLRRGDAVIDAAAWAGHTYAGDSAVYVSAEDRDVAAEVLRSARTA